MATNGTKTGGKGKYFVIGACVVVAAAALIYFGNMWPPQKQDVAGTIGGAQRYRAEQVKNDDVQLGNMDLQKFMQTDTFHRLISDPAARKALASADFAAAFQNEAFAKAFGAGQLLAVSRLGNEARMANLGDTLQAAAISGELSKVLKPEFFKLLSDDRALAQTLESSDFRNLVMNPAYSKMVMEANGNYVNMSQSDAFKNLAADNHALSVLWDNAKFVEMMSKDSVLATELASKDLGKLLSADFVKIAMDNQGAFAAIADPAIARFLIGNEATSKMVFGEYSNVLLNPEMATAFAAVTDFAKHLGGEELKNRLAQE